MMDKSKHYEPTTAWVTSLDSNHEGPFLNEHEAAFSNIIADLVEQWGFKRLLGKIWSLLYLRQAPMSPIDIQEAFAISAGNVNSILKELQQWGVAKRVKQPNDRKFYYKVDEHLWRSMANVIKARELRILSDAIEGLSNLEEALHGQNPYQANQVQHVTKTLQTAFAFSNIAVNAPIEKLSKLTNLINNLRKF